VYVPNHEFNLDPFTLQSIAAFITFQVLISILSDENKIATFSEAICPTVPSMRPSQNNVLQIFFSLIVGPCRCLWSPEDIRYTVRCFRYLRGQPIQSFDVACNLVWLHHTSCRHEPIHRAGVGRRGAAYGSASSRYTTVTIAIYLQEADGGPQAPDSPRVSFALAYTLSVRFCSIHSGGDHDEAPATLDKAIAYF
jgi:hypothetical protein